MAIQTYSGPGTVYFNNAALIQLTTGSMSVDSGNSDVVTLADGWAGMSLGANTCSVSGSGPITAQGLEVNWPAVIAAGQPLQLGFEIAGQRFTATGYVTQCSLKTDRSSPNEHSFEFKGRITAQPT